MVRFLGIGQPTGDFPDDQRAEQRVSGEQQARDPLERLLALQQPVDLVHLSMAEVE
jgi:hypothetical protein